MSTWAMEENEYLEKELVSIKELIFEYIEVYQIIAKNKGIHLIVDLDFDKKIYVEKISFNIVFRNLLDNAIKNTNSGGEVRIFCSNYHTAINIQNSNSSISNEFVFKLNNYFSNKNYYVEKGFGFELIKKISNLLKYDIQVFCIDKKSICFEFSFGQYSKHL